MAVRGNAKTPRVEMIARSAVAAYRTKITELRQTLAWMDVVMSNIADAVAVIKYDGKLLFVNDAFVDLLHGAAVVLLGKNINQLLQLQPIGNSRTKPFTPIFSDIHKTDTYRGSYEWSTVTGEIIILKVTIRYIETTKQAVILLQDATEEHEQETISRNFNNLASHQLRTPITAIKTYVHLLNDGYAGALTEPQKKFVTTIMTSVEHTTRLLNLLLDLSKLKNSTYKAKTTSVGMAGVLENIYTEVQADITAGKLMYSVKLPNDLPKIQGDKHVIHEILSNLITNAIKYTPKEGMITVSVLAEDGYVAISVADTGIGIPLSSQKKIYSQFFRADNAVSVAPSGTGLGLYLVRQLVELSRGELSFKSQLGKGTTFRVKFPVERATL